MRIRRLVLDALIPHVPDVLEYASELSGLDNVDGLTIRVAEIDERTRTVEITIEGEALSFDAIRNVIEGLGGAIHSVDEVSAGSRIVEPGNNKED